VQSPHSLAPHLSFLCFAFDFVVTLYLQDPNGGYGGGPGQASKCSILWQDNVSFNVFIININLYDSAQMPHLATTYAAVNALITVGGERSLSSINRWSVMLI
jgi:protein farnesyltransferase subunit beta